MIAMCLALVATPMMAQAPHASQAPSSAPITAAEQARGLSLYRLTGLVSDDGQQHVTGRFRPNGDLSEPNDKLDGMIAQRAKQWVASLTSDSVKGIQQDPMGELFVATGHDEAAKQQFAARLATPGLSIEDKAYTLVLAVRVFGKEADSAARMRTALEYLATLDALPRRVAFEQFVAHQALADAYFSAGHGPEVIKQLSKAFILVPDIPFENRHWQLGEPGSIGQSFISLADVLSGRPDGRARIDSVGEWLKPYTLPTAALLAADTKDSLAYKNGRMNSMGFAGVLQMVSRIGRPAPDVIANHWWNTTVPTTPHAGPPGTKAKSFADGVIRVTEYGHYGCQGCLLALPKLERLRKEAPPGVEMWYVSDGNGGVWGNTPCTPDEEAEHLRHYYLDRKGYRMPIALYLGDRNADPDGGSLEGGSPTFAAYPIEGYPWFIVTDGKGIVRHVSFGYEEALLKNTVKYLLAEGK